MLCLYQEYIAMKRANTTVNEPIIYEIRVKGRLDEKWSEWFNNLTIRCENENPPVTVLKGAIIDQAMLRSILIKLWDLNLTLISVNIDECSNDFSRYPDK